MSLHRRVDRLEKQTVPDDIALRRILTDLGYRVPEGEEFVKVLEYFRQSKAGSHEKFCDWIVNEAQYDN